MKKIFISLSIFIATSSAYGQFDVVINTEFATGGKVQIKNDDNNDHAFTGITNGKGAGLYGMNTSMSGIVVGIRGSSASITNGTGAISGVTGVFGYIATSSAGAHSAGVRGINNGGGFNSAGVTGYQAGSGYGVYGETPSGFGVYGRSTEPDHAGVGVRGEAHGFGAGVEARYSGSGVGTALQIINGSIKLSGNNRAAFVHTATLANKIGVNSTEIDNVMCNNDPDCFLFVTQKLNPDALSAYNNSPVGVAYNAAKNKWTIFNENSASITTNAQFNILVIKQE